MADTTHGQLIIIHAPEHERARIIEVLANHDASLDERAVAPADVLQLGETYLMHDLRCGNAEVIADLLVERAPDTVFTCWEDPTDQWLGTIHVVVPGLGRWTNDCDNEGTPLFTLDQLLQIEKMPSDRRREELGLDWFEAIERLVDEPEDDDPCECSESYRHRGVHTPGYPADDGTLSPGEEQVFLCDCCAMKLANDDDSACRDFHGHDHASLDVPLGTALIDGPFDWDQIHSTIRCSGHLDDRGEPSEIVYGQSYWHALRPDAAGQG